MELQFQETLHQFDPVIFRAQGGIHCLELLNGLKKIVQEKCDTFFLYFHPKASLFLTRVKIVNGRSLNNTSMLSTNVSTVHFKELSFSPMAPPCFIHIPTLQPNNRRVKAQSCTLICKETNAIELDFIDSQLLDNVRQLPQETQK